MSHKQSYYVPHSSWWPLWGGFSLSFLFVGMAFWLHKNILWPIFFGLGVCGVFVLLVGWFKDVIKESLSGLYSEQMHNTFKLGMLWFIGSELWFFAALFGALVYARWVSVPCLSGDYDYCVMTQKFLYPAFQGSWPLLHAPVPEAFRTVKETISPWGLPLINTAVLLLSACTITIAHHALLKKHSKRCALWTGLTSFLGFLFLSLQYHEYMHAIEELHLYLSSGIYGSVFYFITGFHGLHVFIGSLFLMVIMVRSW